MPSAAANKTIVVGIKSKIAVTAPGSMRKYDIIPARKHTVPTHILIICNLQKYSLYQCTPIQPLPRDSLHGHIAITFFER